MLHLVCGFILETETLCYHVRKWHELSGALIRTPLQHEGSDDAVPQDVPEDHRVGGGDANLAGSEGQDAGGEADGED